MILVAAISIQVSRVSSLRELTLSIASWTAFVFRQLLQVSIRMETIAYSSNETATTSSLSIEMSYEQDI